MSNALDHVRYNCGIAGEEVAEMVDDLEQQRDELVADRTCNWYEGDDGGPWATQCNELFNIENEGPEANGMKFCCFCGKKLVEVVAEAEEEDE